MEKSRREEFITILKVLACIFITNSHCRDIYPLYFLAWGGCFGNAIFFLVSGYCLADIKTGFGEWYRKRLGRILPSVVGIVCIDIFFVEGVAAVCRMPPGEILIHYINKYWFVFAILLCYIIFYALFKNGGNIKILFVYLIIYGAAYVFLVDKTAFHVEPGGFDLFKVYFYLGVMMAGGILRLRRDIFERLLNLKPVCLFAGLAMSLLLWTVAYFTTAVLGKALSWQFLVHVGVYFFAIWIMLIVKRYCRFRQEGAVWINRIAGSALEIYLVQATFKRFIIIFPFPVNLVLFYFLAVGGGMLYHQMVALCRNWKWKGIVRN